MHCSLARCTVLAIYFAYIRSRFLSFQACLFSSLTAYNRLDCSDQQINVPKINQLTNQPKCEGAWLSRKQLEINCAVPFYGSSTRHRLQLGQSSSTHLPVAQGWAPLSGFCHGWWYNIIAQTILFQKLGINSLEGVKSLSGGAKKTGSQRRRLSCKNFTPAPGKKQDARLCTGGLCFIVRSAYVNMSLFSHAGGSFLS